MGPLIDPSEEPSTMTQITTIGLDIAKTSFAVHGFDAAGETVLKKTLKRCQLLPFFAKLAACRIGLEACASAHELESYGDSAFNFFVSVITGLR
jgi:hypothetical protein